MKITLKTLTAIGKYSGNWDKLMAHLGKSETDDQPLSIAVIIDSNGLEIALECLQDVKGFDREIRLYAVWCARQVQHLLRYKPSLDAINVAERFANGMASPQELENARRAAEPFAPGSTFEPAARAALACAMASAADAALAASDAAGQAGCDEELQKRRLRELCAAGEGS